MQPSVVCPQPPWPFSTNNLRRDLCQCRGKNLLPMPHENDILITRHTLQCGEQWKLKQEHNCQLLNFGIHLQELCSQRLEAAGSEQLGGSAESNNYVEPKRMMAGPWPLLWPLWTLNPAAPKPNLPGCFPAPPAACRQSGEGCDRQPTCHIQARP